MEKQEYGEARRIQDLERAVFMSSSRQLGRVAIHSSRPRFSDSAAALLGSNQAHKHAASLRRARIVNAAKMSARPFRTHAVGGCAPAPRPMLNWTRQLSASPPGYLSQGRKFQRLPGPRHQIRPEGLGFASPLVSQQHQVSAF